MGSGAASDSKPVRLPDCSHSNPTPAHVDSGPGRPTVFAAPASGNQERAGNAIPCLDRCYPLWLEERQVRPENLHSHGVLRQEPMWWPLPSPTPQRQVPLLSPVNYCLYPCHAQCSGAFICLLPPSWVPSFSLAQSLLKYLPFILSLLCHFHSLTSASQGPSSHAELLLGLSPIPNPPTQTELSVGSVGVKEDEAGPPHTQPPQP